MVTGLSHGAVTVIRTIDLHYGIALCHFGAGSILPWVISALCLR